jgi:crotonobetainyl-CoA:carnitine CoA-transferase CaiB-like acyl-CoA transferase
LHTNAPHHRDAALAVLGVPADKAQVERAVAKWMGDDLEAAVVQRGGCAAAMRSIDAWAAHPQGKLVREQPLLFICETDDSASQAWRPTPGRPLHGLRILDLTRVLAGPIATRFLAGFGADVLRIDPPLWDEPGVVPDVTLGKRCARLDLHNPAERIQFEELLAASDVLVHGYRADALAALGLDADTRRRIRPGLIDVSLNAYGWDGPWLNRRGFDSLVQISAGIADAGMRRYGRDRPTPLPVQALDHATGYLMAAAVIRGVKHRLMSGGGFEAKASLARTATLLIDGPAGQPHADLIAAGEEDYCSDTEHTTFGPAHRLRAPVRIGDIAMRWDRPAVALGTSTACW